MCHTCTILCLQKTAGLWGQLTAGGDKESMKQRRVASIERAYQRQAAAAEQRAKRKQQEERCAGTLSSSGSKMG